MSVGSTSLIAMPARWSADSVLDLAPDESSRRSGAGLGRPAPWSGAGVAGDLLWGLCAGSGKNPYQVVVDLGGPAYKCSCPSRKFPCKHALGLLLNWAHGTVPEESAPADFAAAWLADRRARAEKAEKSVVRTDPADSGSSAASGPMARIEAGSRRRARPGSAPTSAPNGSRTAWRNSGPGSGTRSWSACRPRRPAAVARAAASARGHASEIAARMVDAQAPGVAGVLRGLSEVPGSGEGWPGRLLGEYAQLHLLARAHQRLGDLPPELAATVRSRVGYPTSRADVLARPAVTDRWAVLGARDLVDGNVPGRRIWLRGRDSGRWAMLLTFAAPGGGGFGRSGGWQDPDTARLRPGTELDASLHYYPGQPALRAAAGERDAAAGPGAAAGTRRRRRCPAGRVRGRPGARSLADRVAGPADRDAGPARWRRWPGRRPARNRWRLIDRAGAALPLADRESLWTLLAVSGGHPVTVAGEWHPDGLLPLTVWHGDRAVAL